ncbi:hypothetical protein SK128_028415 [Halocaridina rubra]|uniref:WWE domain-containing protein n=1 Tax=Halocaridina rubra TaxID=373956 RepID=A0AAN9A578_HALRR
MEFEGDMDDPFEQAMAKRQQEIDTHERFEKSNLSLPVASKHEKDGQESYRDMSRVEYLKYRQKNCESPFKRDLDQRSWQTSSARNIRRTNDSSEVVDPYCLAKLLSKFPKFRATLLQLLEERGLKPSHVREIVSSNKDVFRMIDETVELHPKLELCTSHSSEDGCQNIKSCHKLHLCPVYLTGWCYTDDCTFGHRWFTDHNKRVLTSFFVTDLSVKDLRCLLNFIIKETGPSESLTICRDYNSNGCQKLHCASLHVCQSFVAGRTNCSHSSCSLNHNILTQDCSILLRKHGFSTNETPRDVVMALLSAYPSIAGTEISHTAGKLNKKHQNEDSKSRVNTSSVKQKHSKYGKNEGKVNGRHSDKEQSQELKTHWSHYLYGDSVLTEICYYSVEGVCHNESKGCLRLHSSHHYHWQFSEEGNKWLNLSSNFVNTLENAYNDPNQDGVTLPKLDPSKLIQPLKGLLNVLGRDVWHANFDAMILTNSDYSKLLCLRRLCSSNSSGKAIKTNAVKKVQNTTQKQSTSTAYEWFFQDINNKWVKYGNVDTAGESNLVSSVTSDDIEMHYIQTPGRALKFQNANFTYTIDFNTMTQKNENTNTVRQVSRRPKTQI